MALAYAGGTEATTGSYTKPAVATGNYMAIFHTRYSNNTAHDPTAPSGWSEAYNYEWDLGGGTVIWHACFYRLVDGSEGAGPFVVGGTTIWGQVGEIGVISGDFGTPVVDDIGNASGSGASASTGAVVDMSASGGIVFFQLATGGAATAGNPSAVFGGTVAQQYSLDSNQAELWSESGGTTNTGRTVSVALSPSSDWVAAFVVFKAASGGGASAVLSYRVADTIAGLDEEEWTEVEDGTWVGPWGTDKFAQVKVEN